MINFTLFEAKMLVNLFNCLTYKVNFKLCVNLSMLKVHIFVKFDAFGPKNSSNIKSKFLFILNFFH